MNEYEKGNHFRELEEHSPGDQPTGHCGLRYNTEVLLGRAVNVIVPHIIAVWPSRTHRWDRRECDEADGVDKQGKACARELCHVVDQGRLPHMDLPSQEAAKKHPVKRDEDGLFTGRGQFSDRYCIRRGRMKTAVENRHRARKLTSPQTIHVANEAGF